MSGPHGEDGIQKHKMAFVVCPCFFEIQGFIGKLAKIFG